MPVTKPALAAATSKSWPYACALLGVVVANSALAFDGKFGVRAPVAHNGPCPAKLVFVADFASGRAGEVDFVWTRSDGVEVPGEHLVLEKLPNGNGFVATASLEWQVSPDNATGEEFRVGVKPSTSARPETSRAVKVTCSNGAPPDPRPTDADGGGGSTTQPVLAAPGAFDLGAVSVLVVGADVPAPPPPPGPQTQTFTCPAAIQLGATKLAPGFTAAKQVAATFAAANYLQGKLVCRYKPAGSGSLVQIEMPAPASVVECGVNGRQIVCGTAR
jgi:hypothetical protein